MTEKLPVEMRSVRQGWSRPGPAQTVAFGIPVSVAFPEALRLLSAHRVLVVTTSSLAGPHGLAETIRELLGSECLSVVVGARAHTHRGDVIRLVRELAKADGVVTIGGSSVCDAVKAARLCLANGVTDRDEMDRLRTRPRYGGPDARPVVPPSLPFIAIPTTLSAGEYTSHAGVTDARGPWKEGFGHPGMAPDVVILDPAMTVATPPRLWFATGIRALDHAVETWCSVNATPVSDVLSLRAANLLVNGLNRVLDRPEDMDGRLECMQGAWLSIQGAASGVKFGASHGIGHALGGTMGIPHGETSCIILPHVLRYNAPVNADRQSALLAAFGETGDDLAHSVAKLVERLGLPGRLRDTLATAEKLKAVAAVALHELGNNPRPIGSEEEVLKLLRAAW